MKECVPTKWFFLISTKKVISKFRTSEGERESQSKRMFNHNLLLDCSAAAAAKCVTYGKSKNKTFLFSLSCDIGEGF